MNSFLNIFESATQHTKQLDQEVMPMDLDYRRAYGYSPIVIEAALRNETYPVLIKEGMNRLSSYTNVEYALLLKIEIETRTGTVKGVRAILMRRVAPKRSDNLQVVVQNYIPSSSIVSLKQFQRMSHQDIRQQFRVTIEQDQYIDREFLIVFLMDTSALFRRSQISDISRICPS